jgi:hypothetical protein
MGRVRLAILSIPPRTICFRRAGPRSFGPQSVSLNTKPKQHTAHLLLLQWEPFGAILAGGAAARSGLARHPLGRPLKTGGSDRSGSFEFENL